MKTVILATYGFILGMLFGSSLVAEIHLLIGLM